MFLRHGLCKGKLKHEPQRDRGENVGHSVPQVRQHAVRGAGGNKRRMGRPAAPTTTYATLKTVGVESHSTYRSVKIKVFLHPFLIVASLRIVSFYTL